jgi:hypothetical protein
VGQRRACEGPVNPVTTLYRFYDEDGALLYVGVTNNTKDRFGHHKAYSDWWDLATTHTLEQFGTRQEALKAEERAILTESPIHNVLRPETNPRRFVQHDHVAKGTNGSGIYGVSELAVLLGVSDEAIRKRRQRGIMPQPVQKLVVGYVWYGEAIETYISHHTVPAPIGFTGYSSTDDEFIS